MSEEEGVSSDPWSEYTDIRLIHLAKQRGIAIPKEASRNDIIAKLEKSQYELQTSWAHIDDDESAGPIADRTRSKSRMSEMMYPKETQTQDVYLQGEKVKVPRKLKTFEEPPVIMKAPSARLVKTKPLKQEPEKIKKEKKVVEKVGEEKEHKKYKDAMGRWRWKDGPNKGKWCKAPEKKTRGKDYEKSK